MKGVCAGVLPFTEWGCTPFGEADSQLEDPPGFTAAPDTQATAMDRSAFVQLRWAFAWLQLLHQLQP